jgi:hypothetical protein
MPTKPDVTTFIAQADHPRKAEVVAFASLAEITAKSTAFVDLVQQWIAQLERDRGE